MDLDSQLNLAALRSREEETVEVQEAISSKVGEEAAASIDKAFGQQVVEETTGQQVEDTAPDSQSLACKLAEKHSGDAVQQLQYARSRAPPSPAVEQAVTEEDEPKTNRWQATSQTIDLTAPDPHATWLLPSKERDSVVEDRTGLICQCSSMCYSGRMTKE